MAGLTPEEAARGRALVMGARPTPAPSPKVIPIGQGATRRDEHLAAYIKRVVDAAPPLSPEQAERIAAILRPSVGAA